MKPIDLRTLLQGKTGWVSISPDHKKIIAEARTLKTLVKKIKALGNPQGYITVIGKDYSRFIG